MNIHSTSRIPLTFAVALLVGCWTGASSQGLPCEDNLHCGLGYECINGFCGGEPSDELCGNGYRDPQEACDEGEQNAPDGSCRPDCTLPVCGDGAQAPSEECDEGEQNDDQGACTSICTLAVCGDDLVGPGETCDDGNQDAGDGCSPECTLESCGNGITDPGEDCDDGQESATCNADCTMATCGDQKVNAAAGEACDNDTPAADDVDCMSNCTVPILWDDMEPNTPDVDWTHEKVSGSDLVMDTWMVNSRNTAGGSQSAWDSGRPTDFPLMPPIGVTDASGDIRLMTPALDLSGLEGETIELRFDHARVFTDCGDALTAFEGAVVEVSADSGPFEIVTPEDGYTGTVGDDLCTTNPLVGIEAFTLDSGYRTEVVDLSAYAGSSIVVGFRAGWDCANCPGNQDQRGWFIDNVVVALQ